MAIGNKKITNRLDNPYIEDRDELTYIGLQYPFERGDYEGWFSSTETTLEAVKTNIKMLLKTNTGERLMQPKLGLNLRRYLFEQITGETLLSIKNHIIDSFKVWLPFVEIKNIDVRKSDDVGNEGSLQLSAANSIYINITFNINRDPNTLESVSVTVGE